MEKILLIGGEGYIGNIVANYFLEKGYPVTSFDKLLYNNFRCVQNKEHFQNYQFVYGDILNTKILNPLIEKFEIVVQYANYNQKY